MVFNCVPRDYQIVGAKFLSDRSYAYLADDVGIGKTIEVLEAINHIGPLKTIIIVCPASIRTQWLFQIEKYNTTYKVARVITDIAHIKCASILIMSYEFVANYFSYIKSLDISLLVLDEAHYLASINSQRTKAVLGNYGIVHSAKRVWCLSATPTINTPADLYPVLATIYPEGIKYYKGYQAFINRYCAPAMTRFGVKLSARNVSELASGLKNFMLRRDKKDYLSLALPVIEDFYIGENDKVKECINYEKTLQGAERNHYMRAFGKQAKQRMKLGLAKLEASIERIKTKPGKILVFAHHIEVVEELAKGLAERGTLIYNGGLNQKQKDEVKKIFLADSTREILIANIKSAGTGLDGLQDVCNQIVFVEATWTQAELEQAVGRLYRSGQKEIVTVENIVAPSSIENNMRRAVLRKDRMSKELLKNVTI